MLRLAMLLLAGSTLATAFPLSADILMDGHRAVRHELVFVDSPALAERNFFAAPTAGFGGTPSIEVGQPFRFSDKYGTRLYALPLGEPVPPNWRPGAGEGLLSSGFPVAEVHSVPNGNPLATVLTELRVVSVSDEGIELEVVGETRRDAFGQPLNGRTYFAGLLSIAALGALGLCFILIRRRGARAPAKLETP